MKIFGAFPSRLRVGVGAFLLAGACLGGSWGASLLTSPGCPILPGQEPTLYHFDARVYDANNSGAADANEVRYRVFKPVGYRPDASYPVIVVLHGLGKEGTNNINQMTGPEAQVMELVNDANRADWPAFLVVPQRPSSSTSLQWYGTYGPQIYGLLDDLAAEYSIDRRRVYLMGESFGAYGAYAFVANDPGKWSAAVPMAGGASHSGAFGKAANVVGFPLWNFHAETDGTVNVKESDNMLNEVRRVGGAPMYGRYTSGGHVIWGEVFVTPQLLPWMMAQRLKDTVSGQRQQWGQAPLVRITGYRVGATLSLEGRADDGAGNLTLTEVGWWRTQVAASHSGSGGICSGVTFTAAGEDFGPADVGSRLFITTNENAYDNWNGYLIVGVASATQLTVNRSLPSGSSKNYEVVPPGHRRHPAAAAGRESWSATGIALTAGSNTIGVTGRAGTVSTLGGNLFVGGRTVTIDFAAPAGDTEAPQIAVTGPSVEDTWTTGDAAVTLVGTASDDTGVAGVTWARDLGGSGAAAGTASWSTGAIDLDPGSNVVTVTASDAAGNRAARIVTIIRNAPPAPGADSFQVPGEVGSDLDVLANDADPDGGPQPLRVTGIAVPPAHGTATVYGAKVRYVPAPGYRGADTFSYTAHDGVSAASGTVQVHVSGTPVTSENVLFFQDFSSSASYLAYVNASAPGAGQFNDISAESAGGTWSVEDGRLKLVRAASAAPDNGAGFTRHTDLTAGQPTFVRVSFKFSMNGATQILAVADFDLCGISSTSDYNANLFGTVTDKLTLQSEGVGKMSLNLAGYRAVVFEENGVEHSVEWYVNAGGQPQTYVGPDQVFHTVGVHASSVWINGVLAYDSVPRPNNTTFQGTSLRDFRLKTATTNAVTLTFDDLRVAEVALAIEEDPLGSLAAWRQLHGLPEDGSQDLAEPAGDGVANLIKYALNLAPEAGGLALPAHPMAAGGTAGLPRLDADAAGISFSFVRRRAETNPGVTYQVETSDDLQAWSPASGPLEAESIDATWERIRYVLPEGARRFVRLKVATP